jgi:hypothetical protein
MPPWFLVTKDPISVPYFWGTLLRQVLSLVEAGNENPIHLSINIPFTPLYPSVINKWEGKSSFDLLHGGF